MYNPKDDLFLQGIIKQNIKKKKYPPLPIPGPIANIMNQSRQIPPLPPPPHGTEMLPQNSSQQCVPDSYYKYIRIGM